MALAIYAAPGAHRILTGSKIVGVLRCCSLVTKASPAERFVESNDGTHVQAELLPKGKQFMVNLYMFEPNCQGFYPNLYQGCEHSQQAIGHC
eukprot:344884-Amphidinium_carterae.2